MKIQFVRNYRLYRQGDIVDASEERGQKMLFHGFAVPYDDEPEPVEPAPPKVRKEVKKNKKARKAIIDLPSEEG